MTNFVSRYFLSSTRRVSIYISRNYYIKFSTSIGDDSPKKRDIFDSLFEDTVRNPEDNKGIKTKSNPTDEEIPEEFEHLFEHLPKISRGSGSIPRQDHSPKKTVRSIFQSMTIPEYILNTTVSNSKARTKKTPSKKKSSNSLIKDSEQCLWDSFQGMPGNEIGDDTTIFLADQKTALSTKKTFRETNDTLNVSLPTKNLAISREDANAKNADAYKEYIRLFNDANGQYTDKPSSIYENSCISALSELYEASLDQDAYSFVYSQRQVIEKQLSIYESLQCSYSHDDTIGFREKASIFLKSLRLMNYANDPNNIRIMEMFKVDGLLAYIDTSRINEETDITMYYPIESTMPLASPLKDWYIEPSASIHMAFIKICQYVGGFKYAWQYYCHYLMPIMTESYKDHITLEQHHDIIMLIFMNSNVVSFVSSDQCYALMDIYVKNGGKMTEDITLAMMQVHAANREINHIEKLFDLYMRIPITEKLALMSFEQSTSNYSLSMDSLVQSMKLLMECYIESFSKHAVYCAMQVCNRMRWLEKMIRVSASEKKEGIASKPSDSSFMDSFKFIIESSGLKEYLERFTSVSKQDEIIYDNVKKYIEYIQSITSKQ